MDLPSAIETCRQAQVFLSKAQQAMMEAYQMPDTVMPETKRMAVEAAAIHLSLTKTYIELARAELLEERE